MGNAISFFTPVQLDLSLPENKTPLCKVYNAAENICSWSSTVAKQIHLRQPFSEDNVSIYLERNGKKVVLVKEETRASLSYGKTLGKVLLYATILLPVIAFALKLYFRYQVEYVNGYKQEGHEAEKTGIFDANGNFVEGLLKQRGLKFHYILENKSARATLLDENEGKTLQTTYFNISPLFPENVYNSLSQKSMNLLIFNKQLIVIRPSIIGMFPIPRQYERDTTLNPFFILMRLKTVKGNEKVNIAEILHQLENHPSHQQLFSEALKHQLQSNSFIGFNLRIRCSCSDQNLLTLLSSKLFDKIICVPPHDPLNQTCWEELLRNRLGLGDVALTKKLLEVFDLIPDYSPPDLILSKKLNILNIAIRQIPYQEIRLKEENKAVLKLLNEKAKELILELTFQKKLQVQNNSIFTAVQQIVEEDAAENSDINNFTISDQEIIGKIQQLFSQNSEEEEKEYSLHLNGFEQTS